MVDRPPAHLFWRDIPVSQGHLLNTEPSLTLPRYVAMHTMQEEGHEPHDDMSNEYSNGHSFSVGQASKSESKALDLRDTLLLVVGMLLPLLAQVGHAH